MTSDLGSAYAAGELSDLFQIAPGDTAAALRLRRGVDRGALASALRPHAERLGAPPEVGDSLDRLAQPGSLAVVTGQQAGLLLGPMYTLAKAMTAIKLAARLDTAERPVVPIFWVASQDHDVAEVEGAYLLDGSERLHRTSVELPAGVPVGRIPFRDVMVDRVAAAMKEHDPAPRCLGPVLTLLEETGGVSRTFADWFSAQLYRLLGRHGLVIVDPLEPAVAALSAPVLRRELSDPLAGPASVNAAAEALRARGLEPQLGRGDGATNLFVGLPGEDGLPRRHLLRVDGRGFVADGRRLDSAELLSRFVDDPTVITPAAGLRPIVQDAMLPTAVSVLGPGELAYVAQLRGVYEQHDVAMPLAWRRATVTVLEPAVRRLLDTLGLSASEFASDPVGCRERLLLARAGSASEFARAVDAIEAATGALLEHVDAIDPTLRGTVARGRRHLDMTVRRLRTKSAAALERRDADVTRQLDRLAAHLTPAGQPAERVLSPYSHVLKFGAGPLLDRLYQVGESGHHELRL